MAEGPRWRFLLVDVDGTLLTPAGAVTPRTQAVLRRAVAQGMILVLASGRTYPSLLRIARMLEVPCHLIANGGAVGLTPGAAAVSHTRFFPAELWPEIVHRCQTEGLSTLVFRHRHPEPPLFYVASLSGDPHFESYLGRHRANARVVSELAAEPLAEVVEVAALGSGPAFEAASARVMSGLDGTASCHSMVLYLNARYGKITEFFQAGTSKWGAFLAMFPDAARGPHQVIAVGDESNDVEMIAGAGVGVAMGNGTPELRATADVVTADNDHDGLAQALESLLEG